MQNTTESNVAKHEWEPTDSQGYSMQCSRCGEYIYLENEDWNEVVDAPCPG